MLFLLSNKEVFLINSFLEQELGKCGFQKKFVQVFGKQGLSGKDFHALLSQGFFLKDSSLRSNPHGEFTHAIQWVLIAWQQQKTKFLSMDLNEIYKKLGDPNAKTDFPDQSAWFVIADQPCDNTEKSTYFRSPEWMTIYIGSNQDKFPILQQVLEQRAKKRTKHLEHKIKNPPEERYEINEEIPTVIMPKGFNKN